MNEKKNIVIAICLGICILSSTVFGVIQTVRLGQYKSELEQCIYQLDIARERNCNYEQTFERAVNTNTELGKSLQRQSATFVELRKQLEDIYKCYKEMEAVIRQFDYYSSNDNNSTSD